MLDVCAVSAASEASMTGFWIGKPIGYAGAFPNSVAVSVPVPLLASQ